MASGDSSKPPRSRLARCRSGLRHGNRDHTKLNVPTQHELGGRHAVRASKLLKERLLKQPRTAAQRAPAFGHYSEFVVYSPKLYLWIERMHFDLIDGRNNTGRIDNRVQMLRREARDTKVGAPLFRTLHLKSRTVGPSRSIGQDSEHDTCDRASTASWK